MKIRPSIDAITLGHLEELSEGWDQKRFRLTKFEREFGDDVVHRFNRYGENISLTVKQRNILREIVEEFRRHG